MTETPQYRLRLADPRTPEEELKRIKTFYEINQHPGNRIRDPQELLTSINQEKAYIIEDEKQNIQAVALVFVYENGFREGGGTRVIKNGFGFQKILHACRAVNEYLMDPAEEEYFTVIASWNEKSIKNSEASGFVRWDPPAAELLEAMSASSSAKSIDTKVFLRWTKTSLIQLIRYLLELDDSPVLVKRNGEERILLIIDLPILRDPLMKEILAKIARGDEPVP